MPRDSSGNYTLPIGAFSPGGLIKSSDMNSNFDDIAVALTTSIPTNGAALITAPFLAFQGSVLLPGLAWQGDIHTGFYKAGTHQTAWAYNGVQGGVFNNDGAGGVLFNAALTIGGALTVSGNATVGGTLGITGNTTVGGTLGVSGTLGVTGKAFFTSTDSMALPNGTTAQRNGSPSAGDIRYNSTLNCTEFWNGTTWYLLGRNPTVQSFLVHGSGTVTPSTGVVRWRVRMLGAGGGGGSADANTNGTAGGTTSLGSGAAQTTAVGGGPGVGSNSTQGANGTPGSGGTNGSSITLIWRQQAFAATNYGATISTGGAPFMGLGVPGIQSGTGAGGSTAPGVAGTGYGAGGSGGANSVNPSTGGNGASGEYVEFYINNPTVMSYVVGLGGLGGGASGDKGGAGTDGFLIIEEFYS